MLNTASDFGFYTIACLLLICKWMISVAFLTHLVFYMFGDFFAHIGTVCIHNTVFFSKKVNEFIAVMYTCRCCCIIHNDFAVSVYFDMVFISVVLFIIFLCPTGISIFLCKFMRIFLPFFGHFAAFDLLVFIPAVTLTRGIHKSSI